MFLLEYPVVTAIQIKTYKTNAKHKFPKLHPSPGVRGSHGFENSDHCLLGYRAVCLAQFNSGYKIARLLITGDGAIPKFTSYDNYKMLAKLRILLADSYYVFLTNQSASGS
jgi:hypothetical protein